MSDDVGKGAGLPQSPVQPTSADSSVDNFICFCVCQPLCNPLPPQLLLSQNHICFILQYRHSSSLIYASGYYRR